MNSKPLMLSLSLLAGACALALPAVSHAGNVGYITGQTCSGTGDKTPAIIASGNTPVAITSISPATLAPLSALLVETCSAYGVNADINNAVHAGMGLVISDWDPSNNIGTQLPGAPVISYTNDGCLSDINLPAGSPATNGPGGTLNNTSMDGGNCSAHGSTPTASLPAGVQVLTTTNDPARTVSILYSYGSGKVVYAPLPWSWYLAGGNGEGNVARPGMTAFMTNAVALAAGGGFTTCAAEGFAGPKLILCKQVCEIPQSPARLSALIRMYIAAYREDPPCGR
ncbi:hypothetical protein [Thermomonas sp.]|uniref:hypothetical protein n=1 Tax=Thermomonas sp. TaxID=1971895 RepID=UPI0024887DDA|nr:hypothetical protein [Thermomonas sp.]MDI1254238.1 hypothetical protein [Thermomonas sp.]